MGGPAVSAVSVLSAEIHISFENRLGHILPVFWCRLYPCIRIGSSKVWIAPPGRSPDFKIIGSEGFISEDPEATGYKLFELAFRHRLKLICIRSESKGHECRQSSKSRDIEEIGCTPSFLYIL